MPGSPPTPDPGNQDILTRPIPQTTTTCSTISAGLRRLYVLGAISVVLKQSWKGTQDRDISSPGNRHHSARFQRGTGSLPVNSASASTMRVLVSSHCSCRCLRRSNQRVQRQHHDRPGRRSGVI